MEASYNNSSYSIVWKPATITLVTGSVVLYVCFVDSCLSFYSFSFGHCQTLLSDICRFYT